MAKRKSSSSNNRSTKKQRLDTVALINQMQDEDEDLAIQLGETDATKAIDLSYEESRRKIKREFRTLKPERVLPERRLQLEQRLEYEESKRKDRLCKIKARVAEQTETLAKKRLARQECQELDEKIEECLDLPAFEDATWQTIGKFRCTTKRLAECVLSEEQKGRFSAVLKELAEKGWRTKQSSKDIKAESTKQNDATSSTTQRPAPECTQVH